jgi:hypothetical protein
MIPNSEFIFFVIMSGHPGIRGRIPLDSTWAPYLALYVIDNNIFFLFVMIAQ